MKINWYKVLQLTIGVTLVRYALGPEIAAGTFVICLIIILIKRFHQNKNINQKEENDQNNT